MPIVSAVIPTYRRPDRVVVAVRAALGQTVGDLEVIVVVDGADPATVGVLQAIDDPRLRIHAPAEHLGNAAARNAGIALAKADHVAFLDDDDAWMPRKLEVQLATAKAARDRGVAEPIVACRVVARTGGAELVWPRRLPRAGEPLCDYLYRRSSLLSGEGVVQTSMILAPAALLRRVPFTAGLRRHVDPDWLLRVAREPGVAVVFPDTDEPLAVWDITDDRPRVSGTDDWQFSVEWARAQRELFTPRAYAGFVLGVASRHAARGRAWRAFVPLLLEACRRGRPSAVDLVGHAANFLATDGMRRRVAGLFGRRREARVDSSAATATPSALQAVPR